MLQKLTITRLLLIIASAILVAPWLFTLPAFWSRLNYSQTGQIGDTIGGITSPFINGLAAVLVFITFREQVRANRLLQQQGESQDIMNQIISLDKNNIQIEETILEISIREAFFNDNIQSSTISNSLNKALYFLSEFSLATSLLEQYNGDRNFLYKKLNYLYKIKYASHLGLLANLLEPRLSLHGNLHVSASVEILSTIRKLNQYFENVNRYQS